MDILTVEPFRILHQGYTDIIVEYKNIENDLPFYEQRLIETKPNEFKKIQTDFNSAELYNQKLRLKYQGLPSFKINEISNIYYTKEFKLYKIKQVIRISEYLQKVLKLIFSIENHILKLEKRIDNIIAARSFNSSIDKDICKRKMVIENLFDLLSDIKISITELETDKNSVGINTFVNEIWDTLLLTLAIYYIPDEYAAKIDSIFSGISLKKISSLGEESRNKKTVLVHLSNLKNKLFFIINLFITNLSNQFSYYVTTENFLNNPKGLTVFVIPISMYIMFDFYKNGLTKEENIKKESKLYYSIDNKQMKFLKNVDMHLNTLIEEAKKTKETVSLEEDFFNIKMLLDYYEVKVYNNRIKPLIKYFSDPVIFEKITTMVLKIKTTMVDSINNNENPWNSVNLVSDSKDIDNSTIYFLIKLHESRFGSSKKFPQSQLRDLLNLCSYSTRISTACMNEHVNRYKRGNYHLTDSYENLFLPILMN